MACSIQAFALYLCSPGGIILTTLMNLTRDDPLRTVDSLRRAEGPLYTCQRL